MTGLNMPARPLIRQILRYGLIGLLSNASGYVLYLLLTHLGLTPTRAMTSLYLVAATLGFVGNRQWTFADQGSIHASAARYTLAHLLGYAINLAMLRILVDHYGYPHQAVQALAVFVVAFYLFIVFRTLVFTRQGQALGAR
jgi:putative flippase GtrA